MQQQSEYTSDVKSSNFSSNHNICRVVLAARVDSAHESPDGSIGKKFRKDIDKKMEKLMEPPPNREVKALAVPASAPKKRRGGRRSV